MKGTTHKEEDKLSEFGKDYGGTDYGYYDGYDNYLDTEAPTWTDPVPTWTTAPPPPQPYKKRRQRKRI